MKKYIYIILILLIPTLVFAGTKLMKDANTVPVQQFAPEGISAELLTVNRRNVNMSTMTTYGIFSQTTTCRLRIKRTASDETATKVPLPLRQWQTFGVNTVTPYISLSSCRNSYLMSH